MKRKARRSKLRGRKRPKTKRNVAETSSDNEDDQNPFPSPHPLLISVVLKNLFQFVKDEKDLRSCRQVHPNWNLEAIPLLKKRGGYVHIRTSLKSFGFCLTAYLRDFTNTLENSPNFPFNKICFSVHAELAVCGKVWNKLMHMVAPWVTEVRVLLKDVTVPSIPDGITFPKLTSIEVTNQGTITDWENLPKMVEACPNLMCLSLSQAEYVTLHKLCALPNLNLEYFVLRAVRHTLDSIDPEPGYDWFLEFLNRQRYDLKGVYLRANIMRKYEFELPWMPKLQTLMEL